MRALVHICTALALVGCTSDRGFNTGEVEPPVVNPLPPEVPEVTDTILQRNLLLIPCARRLSPSRRLSAISRHSVRKIGNPISTI